jgi:hypothetical protein
MKAVFGGGGGSARQPRSAAGGAAAATGGENGGAKGTNSGHPTYSIRERLKRARTPTKGGGSGGRGDSLVDDDASEQPSEGTGAGKGGSPSKTKDVSAAALNESTAPRSSWTSRLLRNGDSSSSHAQQPKPERSPIKGIKSSASGKSQQQQQQQQHHPKLKLKSSRSIDSAETRDRVKQIVSQHFAGKHNGGGGSVNANHPRGPPMMRYAIPDGTSDASSDSSSSPQIVSATTLRDDDRDDGKEGEEDDNNDNESPEGYDEFFRLLKIEVSGSHTQVRTACRIIIVSFGSCVLIS